MATNLSEVAVEPDRGSSAGAPVALAAETAWKSWQVSGSAVRVKVIFFLLLAIGSAAIALSWRMTLEPLPFNPHAQLPLPVFVAGEAALITPGYVLTADLVSYNDELFAYLMFDYLRHSPLLRKTKLLLVFDTKRSIGPYRLVMRGQTDLLAALADVTVMETPGGEQARTWKLTPALQVAGMEQQSLLFTSAYNLPVRRKLEDLPAKAVSDYLRRFILFKSATDPRIRLKLEPVPKPLSPDDAQRLAGDIITVAEFFSLPLELLLGIGAMENNYMNIRGDLEHSIWKRRPARDDIVLERRRRRVRVLNDSAGVWQITRETLRYAHALIRRDERDYTQLPVHLRPPEKLNVNEVSPRVLTTYAGVLLRDLLDHFDGDVMLAVSAYNGGPGRPNLRYGEGVQAAAAHARRVLEQSAALNGESVVRMQWLR